MKLTRVAMPIIACASILLLGLGTKDKPLDTKAFQQQSREGREEAAKSVLQERADLVKDLIQLASTKDDAPRSPGFPQEGLWHSSKHLAIQLLGDLRASEAVPALLENMCYRNPERADLPGMIYRYGGEAYPAAMALSKIGMPAVQPLIARLSVPGVAASERTTCLWTMKAILGEKLAKAQLQMSIEETKETSAKAKLESALEEFKKELRGQ